MADDEKPGKRRAFDIRRWGTAHWSTAATIVGTIVAVLALFVTSGGGGGTVGSGLVPPRRVTHPEDSARAAAQNALVEAFTGQYGTMWDELYPTEKAVVSRDRYATCETKIKTAALESLTYRGLSSAPANIPGSNERAATIVSFTGRVHTPDGSFSTLLGWPVAKYEGKWHPLIELSHLSAYKRGKCPALYEDHRKTSPTPAAPRGDKVIP